MKTGNIGKLLFTIRYYRNSVEGPARLGVTRNWFGKGKIIGVWGGGITPNIEKQQLSLLLDPNGRVSAKKTILEGIVNNKVTFQFISRQEVVETLKKLENDPNLGSLAKEAVIKLSSESTPKKGQLKEHEGKPVIIPEKAADFGREGEPTRVQEETVSPSRNEEKVEAIEPWQILSEVIAGGLEGEVERASNLAGICFKATEKRPNNEDALLIYKDGKTLMVVADGMGGHADGEKASALVVEKIHEYISTLNAPAEFTLKELYQIAHQALLEEKNKGKIDLLAGTTAVSALIEPKTGNVTIANVGDSRAYLLRKGRLLQLTPDDSYFHSFNYKDFNFPLSPEETEKYYINSIITSAALRNLWRVLGREPKTEKEDLKSPIPPYETKITLEEGDILILSSDGMHDYLSWQEFQEVAKKINNFPNLTAVEIAKALKEAIKEPRDNVTIAVYKQEKTTAKVETAPPEEAPTVVWTPEFKNEATKIMELTPEAIKLIDQNAELQQVIKRAADIIAGKNRKIDELEGIVAEKNNKIDELEKLIKDLKTSVEILKREDSALREMMGDPFKGLNAYIEKEVKELLKQYNNLASKLKVLEDQRKDYEGGLADQERLLATLKKIIEQQKQPYLEEMKKVEEEYQAALTPEIKGLINYVETLKQVKGAEGKLAIAQETLRAALEPLRKKHSAKVKEIEARMTAELALAERKKMIEEREKAIDELKLALVDLTKQELEAEGEIDNIRRQIRTLRDKIQEMIDNLKIQVASLNEKTEILKKT